MFHKKIMLHGHTGALYALETNSLNNILYSAGSDKLIVAWPFPYNGDGVVIAKMPTIVYSLCHIAHNNELLAATSQGMVHVINTLTNTETRMIQFFNAPVFDVKYFKAKNIVAVLSGDGMVSFCNDSDYNVISTIQTCNAKVRTIIYIDDTNEYVVGNGDGTITIIDAQSLKIKSHFDAHTKGWSVNALCYVPSQNLMWSGSRDALLHSYIVNGNFKKGKSIPAHNYAIYKMKLNASQNLIATCSRDKTIKVWNAKMDFIQRLDHEKENGHINSVNNILWIDDQTLVSCSDDRGIIVWSDNL